MAFLLFPGTEIEPSTTVIRFHQVEFVKQVGGSGNGLAFKSVRCLALIAGAYPDLQQLDVSSNPGDSLRAEIPV